MSLCLLCPGQGSQAPDMFEGMQRDPVLAQALHTLLRPEQRDLLTIAADDTRCYLNRHAQPLIVLYGLAVATALRDAGVKPAVVAGYSIGELTGHAVASALDAPGALQLAHLRAAAMDAAAPPNHGMLAVLGVAWRELEVQALAAGAITAIRNGADHTVLAGPLKNLQALSQSLVALKGAHVVPLPINVPAHSHWLSAGVPVFAQALESAVWQPHQAPVIAGLDGSLVDNKSAAVRTLSQQIAQPIDWARVLDVAVEMGTRAFFEIGPGNRLSRMVRERHPDFPSRSLDDFASFSGAVKWLDRQLR